MIGTVVLKGGYVEALLLGSLERRPALAALVRDQETTSYPVGLAAGIKETHIS